MHTKFLQGTPKAPKYRVEKSAWLIRDSLAYDY